MSSSQELNCKTFYDELNGCPTSRFSGRDQGCLANALGFFPPLILGDLRRMLKTSCKRMETGAAVARECPLKVSGPIGAGIPAVWSESRPAAGHWADRGGSGLSPAPSFRIRRPGSHCGHRGLVRAGKRSGSTGLRQRAPSRGSAMRSFCHRQSAWWGVGQAGFTDLLPGSRVHVEGILAFQAEPLVPHRSVRPAPADWRPG